MATTVPSTTPTATATSVAYDVKAIASRFISEFYKTWCFGDMNTLQRMYGDDSCISRLRDDQEFDTKDAAPAHTKIRTILESVKCQKVKISSVDFHESVGNAVAILIIGYMMVADETQYFAQSFLLVPNETQSRYHIRNDMLRLLTKMVAQVQPVTVNASTATTETKTANASTATQEKAETTSDSSDVVVSSEQPIAAPLATPNVISQADVIPPAMSTTRVDEEPVKAEPERDVQNETEQPTKIEEKDTENEEAEKQDSVDDGDEEEEEEDEEPVQVVPKEEPRAVVPKDECKPTKPKSWADLVATKGTVSNPVATIATIEQPKQPAAPAVASTLAVTEETPASIDAAVQPRTQKMRTKMGRNRPNATLYVRDMPAETTEEQLHAVFDCYGVVLNISLHFSTYRFAFVDYNDEASAESALKAHTAAPFQINNALLRVEHRRKNNAKGGNSKNNYPKQQNGERSANGHARNNSRQKNNASKQRRGRGGRKVDSMNHSSSATYVPVKST